MRAPAFWWRERVTLPAHLMLPLGTLIGEIAARRMRRPGRAVGAPVICIGNPTAGGAGKTPAALAVAARLTAFGERPAFVTRGYGGSLEGPLRVDLVVHDHRATGDEPLLLARAAPTYVARERLSGARLAVDEGASVVVLDDGFQNPSLAKDLSLLVIDGAVGIGNGFCLPAGPLRAPLGPQLELADGVIVVGDGAPGARVAETARRFGKPMLAARLVPDRLAAARVAGRRVVAFASIGRPRKFVDTLTALGAEVVAFHALGDHRLPSEAEARRILERAAREDALVVATEKDVVKIAGDARYGALAAATMALPVVMAFEDQDALDGLLRGVIPAVTALG